MRLAISHFTEDEIAAHALELRDDGRTEEARDILLQAVKSHRDSALLWQALGLTFRALLESLDARDALSRASELAPENPQIAHALARVTLEAGLPATALYDLAAALAPTDGDIIIGRSSAQLADGLEDAAQADLADAVATSPQWLEGHAALARLRAMLGDETDFALSYYEALTGMPNHTPLWLALIDQHIILGRHDKASELVLAAHRQVGDHIGIAAAAAICASETNDNASADTLFRSLAAVQDTDFIIRHVRHLLRTDRTNEAAQRVESLLVRADAGAAWPYAGVCWRMLGDPRWNWLEQQAGLVSTVRIYEEAELAPPIDTLRGLHLRSHPAPGQSARHGTQTDGPLFARAESEIRELRNRIGAAVSQHLAARPQKDETHPVLRHSANEVRFAGSWSVRLTGAGHHAAHIHPQGWLSSVLYLSVPELEADNFGKEGCLLLGSPPDELGLDLPPFEVIKPAAGVMAIFPSIMWHSTAPISGGERMTVACDIAHPTKGSAPPRSTP